VTRHAGRLVAVALAAAVVWLAAAALPVPARLLVVFLLTVLPVLALAQVAPAEEAADELPRLGIYLSSAAALWVLALVVVLGARASGFTWGLLGVRPLGVGAFLLWTAGATVAAVGVVLAGQRLRLAESPLLRHLIPRTRGERVAFAGLSLTAGICEELVFRGFLISALFVATDSLWLAVALSAGAFAVVHAYQRAGGAARAGVLGLLLTLPVLVTGSVLPSMAAHALVDVVGGYWLGPRLVDEGSL
jgi:uncharacterized protein